MSTLTYASTFAGIEGFGLGFDAAGMKCTAQIEINPYRRRLLEERWPDVPKGDDVKSASGRDLGRPDVAIAGFPCKNLSIGKKDRRGLDSDDSGLYWEFHRLVDEHLRLVDATRPRFTVLENVPSLVGYRPPDGGRATRPFNGGRDMAAVVLGLEELGYGWAYAVVDGRSYGLVSRRPRLVLVGHRGGDPRPAWMVLAGLLGRQLPPAVRPEPAGEVGTVGGQGLGGGRDFLVVRKSARPRASADEGGYATWVESDFANVLTANDGLNVNVKTGRVDLAPVKQTHLIYQESRVRALTPLEWERLMGFPDNWTAGMPDEQRLYALGDAFAPPVAKALGEALVEVNAALPLLPERRQDAA